MDNIIEYKVWIVAAVFLILFIAERIKPYMSSIFYPVGRIVKNLLFWPLNIGLSLAVILPVTYWAAQHPLWTRPDAITGVAGLILDIFILDLFIYWWHRAVHEIQFFWRFHEVHHLDEHLDTTSAIRFHFGEVFFGAFIRAAVVMIFAIPFTSVVVFEVLVLAFTLFHHSNIALPRWLDRGLSKIIITPSIHWVHHHALRADTDSNYGTIFSFWDRLFHSKSVTKRFLSMKIGVEGLKDKGFIKLLLSPFKFK